MRIGYNTNGLSHHSLPAAVRLLGSIGYESVAITVDHAVLNPWNRALASDIDETRRLLAEYRMSSVLETGARYLLDPERKHHPTLISPAKADRARRLDFLQRTIDIAAALESDCVSLWAGTPENADESQSKLIDRLCDGLKKVLDYAEKKNVTLGFEPEPGMLIDTMERFAELDRRLDDARLGLTLDIGHLHCLGEVPIAGAIRQWADRLVNIHIEDMRHGIHEHLMFGEGEIDFPPVLAALAEVDYAGGLHVELSRHSHIGSAAAQQAYAFLKRQIDTAD